MRVTLAITAGDAAGIGPEITVKALGNEALYDKCIPIVLADRDVIGDAIRITGQSLAVNAIEHPGQALGTFGTLDVLDLGILNKGDWAYGQVAQKSGDAAFQAVVKAIGLAMDGAVAGIVTGPINKEAIHMAGHDFAGHTEILAHYSGTPKFSMLLASPKLKVVHVTTHVSMREACDLITTQRVLDTILLAQQAMLLLGYRNPRIAVAGFNAHASENGLFGTQEAEAINPAIALARAQGLDVEGPVPPDTVFVKAAAGAYDIVVAMYHDQGHIPFKLCGFAMDATTGAFTNVSGINCTIGLPFVRTSVDHGTAFDRAGQNRANEQSMVEAIEAAIAMCAAQTP